MNGLDAQALADLEDLIATLTGNLTRIVEHGWRADGIVKSMLLHSRGGSGERQTGQPQCPDRGGAQPRYHGARAQDPTFNVTLERDLDPDLADRTRPQDITRVFLNLFGNGFYATAKRQHDRVATPDYWSTVW